MSDLDIEKGAALAAALEQLFEQYPAVNGSPDSHYWRKESLNWARGGDVRGAIALALSTGVPDDTLYALLGLLDE